MVGEAGELLANFSLSDFRALLPEHFGVLALPVAVSPPLRCSWTALRMRVASRGMLLAARELHTHQESRLQATQLRHCEPCPHPSALAVMSSHDWALNGLTNSMSTVIVLAALLHSSAGARRA